MANYFGNSAWTDAARYGSGLADRLGEIFVQQPQQKAMLQMQQQKMMQDALYHQQAQDYNKQVLEQGNRRLDQSQRFNEQRLSQTGDYNNRRLGLEAQKSIHDSFVPVTAKDGSIYIMDKRNGKLVPASDWTAPASTPPPSAEDPTLGSVSQYDPSVTNNVLQTLEMLGNNAPGRSTYNAPANTPTPNVPTQLGKNPYAWVQGNPTEKHSWNYNSSGKPYDKFGNNPPPDNVGGASGMAKLNPGAVYNAASQNILSFPRSASNPTNSMYPQYSQATNMQALASQAIINLLGGQGAAPGLGSAPTPSAPPPASYKRVFNPQTKEILYQQPDGSYAPNPPEQ